MILPVTILLVQPTSVPPISELGPDALLEPMTVDEFTDSLSKKKITIKALLLDQVKTFCTHSLSPTVPSNYFYDIRYNKHLMYKV